MAANHFAGAFLHLAGGLLGGALDLIFIHADFLIMVNKKPTAQLRVADMA
jgi:hypothetical protein